MMTTTDTGTARRAAAAPPAGPIRTDLYDSPVECARARAEAEYLALVAETWSGLTLAEYVAGAVARVRM
ncbi:hypothetical protein [Embleya sp. NPDC020630]|uniref:hypothetical protein n=1 Tax=Embleya sp. NPDC020630 TaxID=3363979 RepID=UPI0037B92FF4